MSRDFDAILKRLVESLSSMEKIDVQAINEAITEVCETYRISSVTSKFYDSARHEAIDDGMEVMCYDSGRRPQHVASYRRMTPKGAAAVAVCTIFQADGETPWTDEENEEIKLIQRTVLGFVGRLRLLNIAERLTFTDEDGFHNLKYLSRYIDQLDVHSQLSGRVALHFNLKHFSLINQQLGRRTGDVVMYNFYRGAKRLLVKNGEVCRIGGDNFAAVTTEEKLSDLLEYLSGTPVIYDRSTGGRAVVNATVGVYRIPHDFEYNNLSQIMDKIVSASTAARRSPVSDIVFYNEELADGREKMMKVQHSFPRALENEEFKVYYQPKVNVITGRLSGAEALCRWVRNGKLVPPMEFIPILEQSMDICRLDFYMLDHTCRDIRRWLDEGRNVVRVSVNLSRKHMVDPDLLEHIMEIIDRNDIPHEYIEIELTETTTDVEFRDLKRVVSGLQELGISTSVDDFGVGYSSLNLIKEIPWNVLKVDRSFLPVDGEESGGRSSAMFKYVVAMATHLGLTCITEGVETAAQVQLLRDSGCDLAQGFLFDRPLPVEEFEKRLSKGSYEV